MAQTKTKPVNKIEVPEIEPIEDGRVDPIEVAKPILSKEERIIEVLNEARQLCEDCSQARRLAGKSYARVDGVRRMLNENIKVMLPYASESRQ